MKTKWMLLALLLAPLSAQAGELEHCHQKAGMSSVDGYREIMRGMHEKMNIAYTGDADTDFVRGMIPHHQGAIDMAKVELANGKAPRMRSLAKAIIAAQEQEIAYMTRWLEVRGVEHVVTDSKSTVEFKEAAAKMHQDMMIDYTGNPDVDFARGMIPHHQGAIDMAKVVVRHGRTPEIFKLAQEVIHSQSAEIGRMERWLEKHPEKASIPSPHHHEQ